jgi:hypothetical protein
MTPALMLPLALVPFVGRPLWLPREASILVERVHDYAPLGGGRSLRYERAAAGKRTGVRFCLDQPGELAVDWSGP